MNIQQVQTIIADAMEKHNGIVKKEELTRLGIDYRRIDELVREGKLVRIRNGYYTDRVEGFSEDALVAALFLCLSYHTGRKCQVWFFFFRVPWSHHRSRYSSLSLDAHQP